MIRQPKYSKEEHARMGNEMYEQQVRAAVEAGNAGRLVAIDVDSGDFELGDSMLEASDRLIERRPDAQIWFVRIGHRAVHHIARLVRAPALV